MGETIRIQHSKDYTVIANAAIRDTRLSFKARGLHHLLLSYPDGWEINTEHLSDQSESDGKTSVCSALKELEKFGYLTREQARVNGRMAGWKSVIREIPSSEPSKKTQKACTARVKPESGFPATENPATENPATENPATENPATENPATENPDMENPATENPATENPATENPATENLLHNKYLIQEVFKKEIFKEESLPAKENLKEEKTQQISANSDLKANISLKQINPHEDQDTPAAPLKNVYAQAKNVWDLIDTFLLSPELADAVIPSELSLVYKEKNQWNGWLWPWRSKTMDKTFQNFNPAVVQKIATDLARRDKATPDQKYGHAMATIGMWEKTKGGWQNLVNWCDRPQPTQPASNDTTEPETEIPEYFYKWSEDVHLMIYENDFRKCHSLQAFYDKRKDHKAWLMFAKQKHPDWDWSLGQKPIIKF
jgi:hypothetical protein